MESMIAITQGEHTIDDSIDTCITTLLGSCVACCLWDPALGIGGMNHMLLASRGHHSNSVDLRGINEMELLINGLIKRGARRDRLLAKAFGGASMVTGLSDIGALNGKFTLEYLEREAITCVSHSLGGTNARQLMFWPATGIARQRLISSGPGPALKRSLVEPTGNGLELF